MKRSAITILWLGLGILLLPLGCAAPQVETKETGSHISKIFAREYDEVWKALEMVMVEELMYPIKVKDKKNGVIETVNIECSDTEFIRLNQLDAQLF